MSLHYTIRVSPMKPSPAAYSLIALALTLELCGCSRGKVLPETKRTQRQEKSAIPSLRPLADDQQTVEVSIQVDKRGNLVRIQAMTGNPALYGPAIEAARQWKHPRCDTTVAGSSLTTVPIINRGVELHGRSERKRPSRVQIPSTGLTLNHFWAPDSAAALFFFSR
jgi:hypothetical protein